MNFTNLLNAIDGEPLFETGLLLVGAVNPNDVRRQLSRWTAAGKVYQLRRGLYALAPPYQKTRPHPFLVANSLVAGSYVSCQSALEYHHLAPEYVPVITSVGAHRPSRWQTPLGHFSFRYIKPELLKGYRLEELGDNQRAFVATPEKALLDMVHLQAGGDGLPYLCGLRLQNTEVLSIDRLNELAQGRPKLVRAARHIAELAKTEAEEYEAL
jgi:hypothetical protein